MNVLAVGAHPDDIELGCGGALLRHVEQGDKIIFLVMTGGEATGEENSVRFQEQRRSARVFGAELRWGRFLDGSIPTDSRSVGVVDSVIKEFSVDVVYVNATADSHQDHRATAEITIAAARRVDTVLLYETPTTLRFAPTVFVDIADTMETKLAALRNHDSQVQRVGGPVDLEAVEAQARYRGFHSRGRLAEAFELIRLRWLADVTTTSSTDQEEDPGEAKPGFGDAFDSLELGLVQ